MMPRTHTAVAHAWLVAALVLSASAGWPPAAAAHTQTPAAVVASRPAPQATVTAQRPGLSPIAVSRLAEGRPSEPQATGTQVPLPTMNQPEPSPGRRSQGSQPPGLKPIAVSQLEEGRRSDSLEQMLGLSFAEPIAIRDLLQLLVRDTNISVVVDPDADGTFNGELKNVSVRQALELILQPINLEYSLNQGVLRVRKRQMQTRIFNINYVAARHIGYGQANTGFGYSNAGLNGLAGGGYPGYGVGFGAGYGGYLGGFRVGSGYGAYGGFGANGVAGSGVGGGLDTFAEMEKGLAMLLSPGGKLNLDRKAGLLQVTDYPDRLDRIANYVEVVETRNLRQIHIQAKVIEVEMNEQFSAGIDWSLVLHSAASSVTLTQPLAPTSSQSAFTMGVNIKDFKGLLSAFASQGRVNVMASPRVMAMNNEPAIMRVGTQDVFFVTTSQVESSTGQLLQTTVTPQTINEGITLSVMAQISEDGIIHLSISPTITERTGTATSRLGDHVPIVSVRETDTVVRVLQGETIVIAGLMQERTFGEKTKVPVLGDVPLVGGLFRRDDRTTKKVDLVILLTPTVVAPGGAGAMSAADQQRLYEEQRVPLRK